MEPVSLVAVMTLIDWKKIAAGAAEDQFKAGANSLFALLKPSSRATAARETIELFVTEFLRELEDKTPLTAALEGYNDQVKRLIESAAPEIAAFLQPEVKNVDLDPIRRRWNGLGLDNLPEDFDWSLVARNFARSLRGYVNRNPELLKQREAALLESIEGSRRPERDPGFDLARYREYLVSKCSGLQVSALHSSSYDLRIALWSVFVPQTAREAIPVRDIPRELLRKLRQEKHLASEPDERQIEMLRATHLEAGSAPVLEILDRKRLVVMLGDPGSGKTSLLRYLALRWVEDGRGPIPIWIDLKQYAQERQHRPGLLEYSDHGCTSYGLDLRRLGGTLETAEAALYLDGLDEIFDPVVRGSVVEEIAALSARYTSAKIAVTSRIIGYQHERLREAGFTHATLEEFDDTQISEFTLKWHEAAEKNPEERARLLDRLQTALAESRAVRELAGNPLLLTMTAILNRTQPLPRNRVELYEAASRVLLEEWDSSRALPVDRFARQEKEGVLRELAGHMQAGEGGLAGNLIDRDALVEIFRRYLRDELGAPDAHNAAVQLVSRLAERNFILCSAGGNLFSFVHRTFLEYFCASWFANAFEKKRTLSFLQLREVFDAHWRDETWHEVLRLLAGMLGEKQTEELILFLLTQQGREHKFANIILAAECLDEVRNRQPLLATAAAVRKALRESALRYDAPFYVETWEEREIIEPTRARAVELLCSVWRDEDARTWARDSAAHDSDWIVRVVALSCLARIYKRDSTTLPLFKDLASSDEHWAVRQVAVQELARGWKENPETLPWLTNLARWDENWDVRRAAVQELARGWKDDPETLPLLDECTRSDEDASVRQAAIQELARRWKDDPKTLPWLKDLARSGENGVVRQAALQELAHGWKDDPETLAWLKDRARFDEDGDVRRAAVQELARGWKHDPETLPLLKDLTGSDGGPVVRYSALQELARGWRDAPETLPLIKDRARFDEDRHVRRAAVQELARGWREDPETLSLLKDRARSDEDGDARLAAVQELARGWRDDPETLPWLKDRARSDEDGYARLAAVRELARGWKDDPETLPWLKDRARSDEDAYARLAAVRELARGWRDDPETLPLLKEHARSDKDGDVRLAAEQELVRGWKGDPDLTGILAGLEPG